MITKDIITYIHQLLAENLQEGAVAVDATAGNGYDTVVLAQCVGKTGQVYAFDIQQQAIANTSQLLQEKKLQQQVKLIHGSHTKMANYLAEAHAILFNLGYLPGGDKNITTKAEDTLLAIQQALSLLLINGLLIIVIYSGHPAGMIERERIEKYLSGLAQKQFNVLKYAFLNRVEQAPYALIIEKLK